jgi:hypothetical protein
VEAIQAICKHAAKVLDEVADHRANAGDIDKPQARRVEVNHLKDARTALAVLDWALRYRPKRVIVSLYPLDVYLHAISLRPRRKTKEAAIAFPCTNSVPTASHNHHRDHSQSRFTMPVPISFALKQSDVMLDVISSSPMAATIVPERRIRGAIVANEGAS